MESTFSRVAHFQSILTRTLPHKCSERSSKTQDCCGSYRSMIRWKHPNVNRARRPRKFSFAILHCLSCPWQISHHFRKLGHYVIWRNIVADCKDITNIFFGLSAFVFESGSLTDRFRFGQNKGAYLHSTYGDGRRVGPHKRILEATIVVTSMSYIMGHSIQCRCLNARISSAYSNICLRAGHSRNIVHDRVERPIFGTKSPFWLTADRIESHETQYRRSRLLLGVFYSSRIGVESG